MTWIALYRILLCYQYKDKDNQPPLTRPAVLGDGRHIARELKEREIVGGEPSDWIKSKRGL